MECPGCRYDNPDDSRFCGECGSSLVRETCPSCGQATRAGQKFCNDCGAALGSGLSPGFGVQGSRRSSEPRTPHPVPATHLADKIHKSKSALEGERKQVTVLFADVSGSMDLAERMDPEEWARIMQRLFAILAEGVERFEGFVDKFTGDGIMALFGAPIAHEDHAQRACYAALHLRDAVKTYSDELRLSRGIDLAIRVGINTGEVVVGTIGDDLHMDYTAQGHTVGLAQRMEQLAAAQSICVSEATAYLVSGYVDLRDLGAATVKGASSPIRVFELVGPGPHRTRLDVARSRGLTRFVGRDADLQALEAALEQACAGNGQVVGVVAEAGTGKSRLCLEFVQRCRARGVSVSEGHCPAHGKTVPYLPLLELLHGVFGIGERDSGSDARRKIAGELLRLDERFTEMLPLILDFLGVPDPERPAPQLGPELHQRQLVAFIRQLVRARSEREPRVLMIDDAQWIDAGSDAFLAQAVEAVGGTRTLVVVNFRPEYHAEWMSRSYYRQLPLLPLGRGASEELLIDLLGRDASLADLAEKVHERTRGNPFFVEEVALSLIESGCLEGAKGAYRRVAPVDALEIPQNVQAVLAARIDRLPERDKQLLQTASVIGKEVAEQVLARVAGLPEAELATSLAALVEGEFLIEKALYRQAEYAFKHPLTQEVAYASQLAARRARSHAAVARVIEELSADRLDEQAALIAYHWEHAGEFLTSVHWNLRAAEWSQQNLPGATQHWHTARLLLAKVEASSERERLELEVIRRTLVYRAWLFASRDEIEGLFAQGKALAEKHGNRRTLSNLHLVYGIWQGLNGNDNAAFARHAHLAAGLAEEVGDEGVALAAAAGLALVGYIQGRIEDAIALGNRALPREPEDLTLGSEYWTPPPVVWLSGFTRFLEGLAGQPTESLADLERLLPLAQSRKIDLMNWLIHMWATHQAELLGDAAGAMAHAQELMGASQKLGVPFPISHYCVGVAHLLAGDDEEAKSCLERSIAIHQEQGGGPPPELLNSLSRLAVACANLGQYEQALEISERGLQLVRMLGFPVFVALSLIMHAQVLRKTRGTEACEAIESALNEAETLVESSGIRSWQPFIHVERAELATLAGDDETRSHQLREAHRLFTAMGATGHLDRLTAELGS
jgi:class 3 adenylate cyclase/tetratricopeptide (TPR) repeat protein